MFFKYKNPLWDFDGYEKGLNNESLKELDRRIQLPEGDLQKIDIIDIHAHCFDASSVSLEIVWAYLKEFLPFTSDQVKSIPAEPSLLPKNDSQDSSESDEHESHVSMILRHEREHKCVTTRFKKLRESLEKRIYDIESKINGVEKSTENRLMGIFDCIKRIRDFLDVGFHYSTFKIAERYFEHCPRSACVFLPISISWEKWKPKINYYVTILTHLAMAGCVNVTDENSEWLKCFYKHSQIQSMSDSIDPEEVERYRDILKYIQDHDKQWKSWKGRFIPAVGIDPNKIEDKRYVRFINECFTKFGAVVAKLYPAMGFLPTDPSARFLLEQLTKHQIPTISHGSYGGIFTNIAEHKATGKIIPVKQRQEYYNNLNNWVLLFKNYQEFKDLKICLAHVGGSGEFMKLTLEEIIKKYYPQQDEDEGEWELLEDEKRSISWHTLDLMNGFPNVYTDIAYTGYDDTCDKLVKGILEASSKKKEEGNENKENYDIAKKFMFGTDYWINLKDIGELEYYKKSIEGILRDHKYVLAIENCKRFLGMLS